MKTHECLRSPGARLAASMVVSLLMLAAAGSASAQCRPVGYTAQYMEAIFSPGMTTEVHYHPGPEALYTTAGGVCFEMPHGEIVGQSGEGTIMQAGHLHTLTASGTEQRRSLALVIHESSQPWRLPSSDWTPAGLCK